MDTVLNLSAFDLDQVLERRPTFLEPEYPFEWTGVYALEAGRYELSLAEADPEMSLVATADQALMMRRSVKEPNGAFGVTLRRQTQSLRGPTLPLGAHVSLQLQADGRKSFFIDRWIHRFRWGCMPNTQRKSSI